MEQSPEQREHPPRNVRTHFEETRAAMAEVEGGGWLYSEKKVAEHWAEVSEGDRRLTLEGAKHWLETVRPDDDDELRVVYGDGGVNRWQIWPDGSVHFLKFYASADAIRRAREHGFEVD